MIQPTLNNLHHKYYTQGLCCYLFVVNLDRSVAYFNTLNDQNDRVCIQNKAKDWNLSIFNLITRTNEWKILTKDISCEYKCKFDGGKCNSNQNWDNYKCWCECKNLKEHHDDSVITSDEITDKAKIIPTHI